MDREKIIEILVRLLQTYNSGDIDIQPETNIASELSIDYLAVLELKASVEDEFEVHIPLKALGSAKTVADLASIIAARLASL